MIETGCIENLYACLRQRALKYAASSILSTLPGGSLPNAAC